MAGSDLSVGGDVNASVLINGSGNHVTYQVVQSADLSGYLGDDALTIFVSSDESQLVERDAVLEAVKNMCGLSQPRLLNRIPSEKRTPKEVEDGLGCADLYFIFARMPLSPAQEREFQQAREKIAHRFIFCDAQVQVLIGAAYDEPEEHFVLYSDAALLRDLILGALAMFIVRQVRAGNNQYRLNRADLLALLAFVETIPGDTGWLLEAKNWLSSWKPEQRPVRIPKNLKTPDGRVLPEEPETILIPAGVFWMGSTDTDRMAGDDEKPYHQVYLDAYRIARYPVTVAQFARFARGYQTEAEARNSGYTWRTPRGNNSSIAGREDHPVVNVSWGDAAAYCEWLSRETGRSYRLPTETEWEKAARGTDGRIYPWGSQEPDRTRCNIEGWFDGTTAVGSFGARGESPYGCADMAGNVWEWCLDWYGSDYYRVSPRRNPMGPETGGFHIIRGGSWGLTPRGARCASRSWDDPDLFLSRIGYRPVLSLADSGF